ncbi:MAG TPA: prepilin peptidase [Blastocatellia bacterium]|nr:prepilin peptidase [Blastocatellia bacterium]
MENLPAPVTGVFVFLFGLAIGSFLNVVIHRLPLGESLAFPGSHCPRCNAPIKPYDNIPVMSYLLLGGKCRSCQVRISPLYPAVELLVGVLFVICYIRDGWTLALLADAVFVSLIVPLVFIDLYHMLLLNVITYPGLVVLLVLRTLSPDPWIVAHTPRFGMLRSSPDWMVSLAASVIGALVGGGSLWLVRELYFRIRRVEGMGLGDVKMMLMVGAFLGWQLTVFTIFLAALLGSIVGVSLVKLRGSSMKTEIPFGVFLGPAGIIAMFLGRQIWDAYTNQFHP